jgi:hypothetical protein
MKKTLTSFSISRLVRYGLDEEVLELVEESTAGLAALLHNGKLSHNDFEKVLVACFRSQNAQRAVDICRGVPSWSPMAKIITSLSAGFLDLGEINREAFKAFSAARNWNDKTLAESALKCLHLSDSAAHTTAQRPTDQRTCDFLRSSELESGLYISDIDIFNSVSSGSATRVIDICRKNNLGYLYVGNDATLERVYYNGIRCYPLNILNQSPRLSTQFTDRANATIPLPEIILLSLRRSRCSSISSLLEYCLNAVGANIGEVFPKLKRVVVGYIWNTFMVSGYPATSSRPFNIYIDTHDILSQRYADLSLYGQTCYKISQQDEINILNHYDTSIYINSDDATQLDTTSSKLIIYPSINKLSAGPNNPDPDSASDLMYIGGLQTANLTGLFWFASEVMPHLDNITLNVWGSICRGFSIPSSVANRIHLRGRFESHESLVGNATLGIAPLFYGSGTKLKVIEYLSLGLDIVGTDTAFYGFNSLKDVKCFSANNKREFIDRILHLLSDSHKTVTIDPSEYLPSPKLF